MVAEESKVYFFDPIDQNLIQAKLFFKYVLTSRHTGTTISLLLVNSFKAIGVTCEDCGIYFENLQSVTVCWKCKKCAEASDEVSKQLVKVLLPPFFASNPIMPL